ncbi:GPI mannosyltransferase 3 [Adelges cooleyi]|uniref:GPI mannosyltransferase 3 n=1 Tax=Adelges cooleyi TaxID=133065 RepID=UPI00218041E8|nr:GPI mannosyltransferase 3 [Adelges cooleyi]XP_050443727.1 GPI mannosyltransferase 3 [Adelges cooleyi]XP_050443728.1 GPI mannosyltransferase 3 [Adelges cooleyi]
MIVFEMKKRDILLILLLLTVRLIHLLIVRSWFVPDEYWQALEIAHRLTYGYGYRTWEWILGIRSYVSVLWIVLIYKTLNLFHLDSVQLLIWTPRVFQMFFSVYSDYCFIRWLQKHSSCKNILWPAIYYITCPFLAYCSTRTIVNTTELNLTTIALYHYPWSLKKNRATKFLWIVGLLCIVRPTAVIIWLPLVIIDFFNHKRYTLRGLYKYVGIGVSLIVVSIILDSYLHGSLVFTQWNFLYYNVFKKVNEHYSTEHWAWYFINGLPPILGPITILFTYALFKTLRECNYTDTNFKLIITILWSLIVFSMIGHKEHRFLLPLLPMIFFVTSQYIYSVCKRFQKLTVIMTILNTFVLCYLGQYHQVGSLNVMSYLATLPKTSSLLFLMPCHSTPLYSHLHINVTTRILTCEPNINNTPNYKDEADIFFENPTEWFENTYLFKYENNYPSHIIMFNVLSEQIEMFLKERNYKKVIEFFHTYLPNNRVGSDIHVFAII